MLDRPLWGDPMIYTLPPKRSTKPQTAHWASSLVGCLREAYYKWIGAPITNPPTLIQRQKMEAGDDDKETFARKFSERSKYYGLYVLDVQKEVSVAGGIPGLRYPIHGKIDLVYIVHDTRNGFNHKRMLAMEFKSTAQYGTQTLVGYHERTGTWVEGDLSGHPQYLAQIWAYMKFYPQPDEWFLIAWDRVSRLHATYVVREHEGELWWSPVPRIHPSTEDPIRGKWRKAPFTWEQIIQRLLLLEEYIAKGELPPRFDPVMGVEYKAHVANGKFLDPPSKTKENEVWWKCHSHGKHYCQYAHLCWGLVSWEEAQKLAVGAELLEED